MSREAFAGARSRKSMNVERPSAKRTSMNPPPPMLPAEGCVTASAKPTATAASTALPPAFSTATPASVACCSTRDHHGVPRVHRLRGPYGEQPEPASDAHTSLRIDT